MTRPDGLIELPNGSAIFYDDPNHAYYRAVPHAVAEKRTHGMAYRETPADSPPPAVGYRRGKRLTGASTLAKVGDFKPDNLLRWKERMTCAGVAELLSGSWQTDIPDWAMDGPSMVARLKEKKVAADDQRDRKGTVGTNVHKVLEQLAGTGLWVEDLTEEEKGYARAVRGWWEERDLHALNVEQFVYSETHGYAGRFDLRGEDDRGSICLIDLKTGWVGNGAHIQMQLYAMAAMECGVGACDELIILQVKDDGTWKEIPVRATEADAIAAIAVYRAAARIEREAKAA